MTSTENRVYPVSPAYRKTALIEARMLHGAMDDRIIDKTPAALRHIVAENVLHSLESKYTWPTTIPKDIHWMNNRWVNYLAAMDDIEAVKKGQTTKSYLSIANGLIETAIDITDRDEMLSLRARRMGVPIQKFYRTITDADWWRYRIVYCFNKSKEMGKPIPFRERSQMWARYEASYARLHYRYKSEPNADSFNRARLLHVLAKWLE